MNYTNGWPGTRWEAGPWVQDTRRSEGSSLEEVGLDEVSNQELVSGQMLNQRA